MESFDKADVVETQIKPLTNQIFALCKEHQIPGFFVGVSKNETEEMKDNVTFYEMAFFPGPERTPIRLAIMAAIMEEDYEGAFTMLLAMLASITQMPEQSGTGPGETASAGTLLN